MAKFFVSYRHPARRPLRDGSTLVERIEEQLHKGFDTSEVVVDHHFIPGDPLDRAIDDTLENSIAVLVVIDANWRQEIERLHEPGDWVRREIAMALQRRIPIVPLLVDGTMPSPSALPPDVRELTGKIGFDLESGVESEATFVARMAQLCDSLRQRREAHMWAAGRLKEVQKTAHGGDVSTAQSTCAEARLEYRKTWPDRVDTRPFQTLEEYAARLDDLSRALVEFDKYDFLAVLSILESAAGDDALIVEACRMADIGMAGTDALNNRDRHGVRAARLDLGAALKRVDGKLVAPGGNQVSTYLTLLEPILDNLEALDKLEAARGGTLRAPDPSEPVEKYVIDTSRRHAAPVRITGVAARPLGGDGVRRRITDVATAERTDATDLGSTQVARLSAQRHKRWMSAMWVFLSRLVTAYEVLSPTVPSSWGVIVSAGRDSLRVVTRDPASSEPATPDFGAMQITVTAPRCVRRGEEFPIAVWMHPAGEQTAIIARAKASGAAGLIRDAQRRARRSMVRARVAPTRLTFETREEPMTGEGASLCATFVAQSSRLGGPGMFPIEVDVYLDCLKVARLAFQIEVGDATSEIDYVHTEGHRTRRVFACCAEEDVPLVASRLERLTRMWSGLTIDGCTTIRPRERSHAAIAARISDCDGLYLFWSPDARQSGAVTRAWQYALEHGGTAFISAVNVAGDAPPPTELQGIPFYRWEEPAVS